MIDDDIRIEKDWFERVEEIFRERWDEVDFVGGKVLPIFETTPPEWVITIRDVGICWRDYGEDEWQYNQNTPILTGGHAVLKSEIFEEVGFYPEDLGVMKKNLASCEDEVMFDKLILAGKRGFYSPKMVVHHFVPTRRVTKNFFRQWYFGAGKSWNVVEENHKPFLGAKIFRVPRYMYRDALLSSWRKFKAVIQRDEIESLRAEKEILLFLGFFYGRNIAGSKLDNPLKKITEISIQIAER